MIESFTWNAVIGVGFAILTNTLLQRFFPTFRNIRFTSLIVDGGVFTFWSSMMGAYTLGEL